MSFFALLLAACFAALVTGAARQVARRRRLLDVPTGRSSHVQPTPRLGGVGIVVGCLAGWWLLGGSRTTAWPPPVILTALSGAVVAAVVGLLDDLRPLSPATKLAGEILAAAPIAIVLAHGPLPVRVVTLGAAGFWILYYTNVFNFMDGSDGLAGGVSALNSFFLGMLALERGDAGLAWAAFAIGAACLGFLTYNYPPASIFMGDAGSLFLGYGFSVLALGLIEAGTAPAAVVLAVAPFLVDGSCTLARRALAGERVWQAHRTHWYQRLIVAGRSHRWVAHAYYGWCAYSGGLALLYQRSAGSIRLIVALLALAAPAAVVRAVWTAERARSAVAAGR